MRWLLRLLPHWWVTTHVNRWHIPTRQECCICGCAREWRGGPAGEWVAAPEPGSYGDVAARLLESFPPGSSYFGGASAAGYIETDEQDK